MASLGAAKFVWATDSSFSTAQAYDVRTAGVTVVIDKKGQISYRDDAPTTKKKLKEEIERALNPSPARTG